MEVPLLAATSGIFTLISKSVAYGNDFPTNSASPESENCGLSHGRTSMEL